MLCVRPQHELRIAAILAQRALENFVPVVTSRRQWSDRVKTIAEPLFAGYVFVRYEDCRRGDALKVPGVNNLLQFGRDLAELTDTDIDTIRMISESRYNVTPCAYLKSGDHVRIQHGPLAGLEAILLREHGQTRVVVSVDMLQRSVAVEVDRADLELTCAA